MRVTVSEISTGQKYVSGVGDVNAGFYDVTQDDARRLPVGTHRARVRNSDADPLPRGRPHLELTVGTVTVPLRHVVCL